MMEMRKPELPENMDTTNGLLSDGRLWFGEGSLRGTAAGMIWLGLLALHSEGKHDFKHEQVAILVDSLMNIKTIYPASEATSKDGNLSCMLRIMKQNKALTFSSTHSQSKRKRY